MVIAPTNDTVLDSQINDVKAVLVPNFSGNHYWKFKLKTFKFRQKNNADHCG